MSNQDPVTVIHVDWLKLLPWLNLWQSARMGFRLRVLLPACALLLCSLAGPQIDQHPQSRFYDVLSNGTSTNSGSLIDTLSSPAESRIGLPRPLSAAVLAGCLFAGGSGPLNWQMLPILIWNVVLIGVFGVAISRSMAADFCGGARVGGIAALKYAVRKLPDSSLSMGIATLIVAVTSVPLLAMSWITRTFAPESLSYTMLALPLALAFAAAVFLLACLFCLLGWLLSIAGIGTDQCSGSDALSRGISYILSHRGYACWFLFVATVVSSIARWLAGFGLLAIAGLLRAWFPQDIVDRAGRMILPGSADYSPIAAGWTHLLMQLPDIVHLGTFLSGLTVMYLLLRQAEDGIDLREMDGGHLARKNSAAAANNPEAAAN